MKSCLYIALALTPFVSAMTATKAATIHRDYVVDLQPSDIERKDSSSSAIFKRGIYSDWFEARSGDTFTGTIRFSGISQFHPTERFGIDPGFFFGQNQDASYRMRGYTTLIDKNGNLINPYYFFSGGDNRRYFNFGAGGWIRDHLNTSITGVVFSLEFNLLQDSRSKNPARLQLYNVTIGGIRSVAAPVPEPATWAMMILGLTGAGLALRRQRTTNAADALA